MPITYGDMAWPPAQSAALRQHWEKCGAWWSGSVDDLVKAYGGGGTAMMGGMRIGGFRGAIQRFWYGRPQTPGQDTTRVHVPAPADISSLMGTLLFSDPLKFYAENDTDQGAARTDYVVDKANIMRTLLEAAQPCSAFGGVYLRASVNVDVRDVPIVDAILPDVALPEWGPGPTLLAVTFWRQLPGDPKVVYRHLERHEPGYVYHALYMGTEDKLGRPVPLSDHTETDRFAMLVDEYGGIETGAPGLLDVVYVPNARPNPDFRGSANGKSDYAGLMPSFDALDETWSSLIRDVRNGKGRIIVDDQYLKSWGRGSGAMFDSEQGVFRGVNRAPGSDLGIEVVQFEIRTQQHMDVISALWRTILRGCGLAEDAFGEDGGGAASATAKEIGKRGERTEDTRLAKISYWKPEINALMTVVRALDVTHFAPSGVEALPMRTEWPKPAVDLEAMSGILQKLDAAAAVSTSTKVAWLHPDWSQMAIDEEVAAIDGAPLPDPMAE